MYRRYIKRILDFTIALMALIVLFPVLFCLLVFVTFKLQGNPFFLQERPGLYGRIFTLIKIKTMNDSTDNQGKLLPDKDRTTFWGSWIRKTSMDELLQLINVLKGEMSLIGPRPLLIEYLPLYSVEQQKRHAVLPGITGWAQVNGRNAISWKQKFELDIWYVEHLNLLLDIKIGWLTIKNIFLRKDINNSDSLTMPLFNGNN